MKEKYTRYTFDTTDPIRPVLLKVVDLPREELPVWMRQFKELEKSDAS